MTNSSYLAVRSISLIAAGLLSACSSKAVRYAGTTVLPEAGAPGGEDASRLLIETTDGRTIVPPKDSTQVSFGDPLISPDGRAVGWLAYYPNCCTSYPIPLKLFILAGGPTATVIEPGLPIWQWRLHSDGLRVAFRMETVHGGLGKRFELRERRTGQLVEVWEPGSGPVPAWADSLRPSERRPDYPSCASIEAQLVARYGPTRSGGSWRKPRPGLTGFGGRRLRSLRCLASRARERRFSRRPSRSPHDSGPQRRGRGYLSHSIALASRAPQAVPTTRRGREFLAPRSPSSTMDLKITGEVTRILDEESGTGRNGPWRKQAFILKIPGDYPREVCVIQWGDNIDKFAVQAGESLTASIDVQSREHNSRWYTDVKAWKIERPDGASGPPPRDDAPPPLEAPEGFDSDDDSLPF